MRAGLWAFPQTFWWRGRRGTATPGTPDLSRFADPYPDPAFHCTVNADPNPVFHFNTDQDQWSIPRAPF